MSFWGKAKTEIQDGVEKTYLAYHQTTENQITETFHIGEEINRRRDKEEPTLYILQQTLFPREHEPKFY
jgi:hypothetical protein